MVLNDADSRKTAELKMEDGKVEKHFLFYDGESVAGKVSPPVPHCSFGFSMGKELGPIFSACLTSGEVMVFNLLTVFKISI